ncbi:N-(5'-phosphoribosyl)anthranilate isomerase [Acidocella aquatica]|uniref:N-(5'-phosphoribosyl)anthranilate isomerase n=1 Tax=Acidocella aquatica TaxID=1922313 RepID=A0ABQ6A6J9_9PROT|nr:phosphoribosylanthranilate isomerase [Acidocella aquatica]GLR65744.1 N-(5'-phosphoribosyl)anthranilate isomerase [Acidocella aquatica]
MMALRRKVKICGINSPASFDAVVEAGADYLGFVFFPASPRYVTPGEAAALAARHAGGPLRVGLFVNPGLDEIDEILQQVSLDILQVHAPVEAIAALRNRFGRPVWRAVGVATPADFPAPDEVSDGYVVEAKPPPGATRPGGNAVLADWNLLSTWRTQKLWLLAGGLNPGNVITAMTQTNAPGADVSSGVETAPGEKSPELIRQFVAAVRRL